MVRLTFLKKKRPKIKLLLYEHPTEGALTHFHAKKVAELLKKKGHEVEIMRVPFEETNYGIITRAAKMGPEEIKRAGSLLSLDSVQIAQKIADKNNCFVFNFHCSPAEELGRAETIAPKKFRVSVDPRMDRETEVIISGAGGRGQGYLVELPAKYFPIRKELVEKNLAKFDKNYLKHEFKLREYITKQAAINHPEQKKYLNSVISQKLAKRIQGIVMKNRALVM